MRYSQKWSIAGDIKKMVYDNRTESINAHNSFVKVANEKTEEELINDRKQQEKLFSFLDFSGFTLSDELKTEFMYLAFPYEDSNTSYYKEWVNNRLSSLMNGFSRSDYITASILYFVVTQELEYLITRFDEMGIKKRIYSK